MPEKKRKTFIKQDQTAKLYAETRRLLSRAGSRIAELLSSAADYLHSKSGSWWRLALIAIFTFIFLYYPVGGWMIHDIDTSNSCQPEENPGRLASIDVMSCLINREVHHKIWTPNLPFLFSSYFLDNMPNFQLGLMSAVSRTAYAFGRLRLTSVSPDVKTEFAEAVELLQYPGNIWLFSPQNNLLPAPSSNTQYKKGRKKLNNFNNEIAAGRAVLNRDAANLAAILKIAGRDIDRQLDKTDDHIRETHDSLIDFKSDDIFYFDLGKLYGYAQIFKALGRDYKNVLVKRDVYLQWTMMLNFLERASDLNPAIIRNGKLNASFAPNHLVTINYFAARAVNLLDDIVNKLNQPVDSRR